MTASGGPQPESTIEFAVVNDTVTTVTGAGLLAGVELGTTKVRGRAVGVDQNNGFTIYSQVSVFCKYISIKKLLKNESLI